MQLNVPLRTLGLSPSTKPEYEAVKAGFGASSTLLALLAVIVSGAGFTTSVAVAELSRKSPCKGKLTSRVQAPAASPLG